MKIKRYCELCGADYWTGNGKAKYCSEACRKEATRRRQAKWRVDNPDYQKKYAEEHPKAQERFKERHPNYERDRWRKIRGTIEQTKVCIVCGKEFITTRPQKMTCSEECKRINCKEKQRERSKRRERSPEEEHRKYIIHTYGSEEAHAAYLEKKQAQIAQTKAHREREQKERLAANIREGKCVVCGKAFTTYNPAQKTCCSECGKKLSYARSQKRIPKAQMIDKDITLEALYRRDSGVCYLCGGRCDWSDKDVKQNRVGKSYPSIDHIIPVSRGGLHAWNNVRLAHFGCNVEKADSLIPNAEKLIPKNAYQFKRNVRPRKKKTLQFTKDMTLIAEYESTAEAERVTGIAQKKIQDCARGRHKTSGGYVWRYA